MNKCISCLESAKDLHKGYCGKCETVIVNRLTKARDRGTGDRSPVTKDLLDEPGNKDFSSTDYFEESIVNCSKCDFTFNAKEVCSNCKRCINCCPSWELQNC